MATDVEMMRQERRTLERALRTPDTAEFKRLIETMAPRSLGNLRRLLREKAKHISRTTYERIEAIEARLRSGGTA